MRRGLLRVEVACVGADLCDRIVELERLRRPEIVHFDLLSSSPLVDAAVEHLRRCGFFFCALLPEFVTTEVIRLQRLCTNSWVRPELVHPRARAVLETVLADRRSVLEETG